MVYIYHNFLIYSSADGHLGCFHVLAIITVSSHCLKASYLIHIADGPKDGPLTQAASNRASFLGIWIRNWERNLGFWVCDM